MSSKSHFMSLKKQTRLANFMEGSGVNRREVEKSGRMRTIWRFLANKNGSQLPETQCHLGFGNDARTHLSVPPHLPRTAYEGWV